MANGEDTRHHPNRKVGRSELPRLSARLSDHLNETMAEIGESYDEPAEEFAMATSIPSIVNHPFGEYFSENDAAEALSKYRSQRNAGELDKEDIALYGNDINEALRDR
jgi:hypothetical protein